MFLAKPEGVHECIEVGAEQEIKYSAIIKASEDVCANNQEVLIRHVVAHIQLTKVSCLFTFFKVSCLLTI